MNRVWLVITISAVFLGVACAGSTAFAEEKMKTFIGRVSVTKDDDGNVTGIGLKSKGKTYVIVGGKQDDAAKLEGKTAKVRGILEEGKITAEEILRWFSTGREILKARWAGDLNYTSGKWKGKTIQADIVLDGVWKESSGTIAGLKIVGAKQTKGSNAKNRTLNFSTTYIISGSRFSTKFAGKFSDDFSELSGTFSSVVGRGTFTLKRNELDGGDPRKKGKK